MAAYKKSKQTHIWKKMSKTEQQAEIRRNRGKQQGRGRRFPVEINEAALGSDALATIYIHSNVAKQLLLLLLQFITQLRCL